MKKNDNTKGNRNWLVFANEDICKHYESLKKARFISWKRNDRRYKMLEGDIVYIFSSKERKIIFKTKVIRSEERQDNEFWIIPAPKDNTWRLEAIQEYTGNGLDEVTMRRYGFNGGRSIETPMCNNPELFAYIESQFEK